MLFHSYRPFAKILKYKMKLSLTLNAFILLFFTLLLCSCLIGKKGIIVFKNKSNDTLTIITNKHDLFEFIEATIRKPEKDTIVSKFNFSEDLNKNFIWASIDSIYNPNKHIKNINNLRRMLKDSTYTRFENYSVQIDIKYNPDFGKLIQSNTAIILPEKSLTLEFPYQPMRIKEMQFFTTKSSI